MLEKTFTPQIVDSLGNAITNTNFEVVSTATGYNVRVLAGATLDFETTPQHQIYVKVTDSGGNIRIDLLTIDLQNVNEAPTNVTAALNSIAEGAAAGTVAATLSSTDADSGESRSPIN